MSDARAEPDKDPDSARWAWVKRVGRPVLLALGIGAIVLLVRDAGPEQVLSTLLGAGIWLPVILVLEAAWMAMDIVALRLLYGAPAQRVPVSAWVRSAMMAYGIMVLLPGGRAGGEVARAATLAPHVGGPEAAAVATRLQAATLLANTAISVPCLAAVWIGSPGSVLAWMVLVNASVTGILGGAIILATKKASVGGWLGKRIAALASHGSKFDEALRGTTPWWPAVLATSLGRTLQALQYGLMLVAVGGSLTVVSAFVSQAIHLVGAGLGDFVPNQVGITEGAYRIFAPALGLENDPARAIGIALIARTSQFLLAGVCLGASSLWSSGTRAAAAVDPTA